MVEPTKPVVYEQKYGRTWYDFLTGTGGFLILVCLGVLMFFWGWDYVKTVPTWVWASLVITPILWSPWLMARAKEGTQLFVVTDGPQRMTEYRVGKRVKLDIEGAGLSLSSRTGTHRTLLTSFNPETLSGEGTALADFTQFEMARDLGTLDRLSRAFSQHLREERITQELIAVEVQKRVKELSERWIGIAMSTLEPSEIESALAINESQYEQFEDLGDVIDD